MNHGYCKNCWWWKMNLYIAIPGTKGICYMQSRNVGIDGAEILVETKESDYCPDYTNRKKEEKKSGTLKEWIETQSYKRNIT